MTAVDGHRGDALPTVSPYAGERDAWDAFVRRTPGGTLFHLIGWKEVLDVDLQCQQVTNHVVILGDPTAGGQLTDDGLVELAAGRVVDRLDARLGELELGFLQGTDEAPVLPGAPLGLDEEAEAVVEGEGGEIGLLLLGGPGDRHGVELEGLEVFHRGSGQHQWVPFTGSRLARGDDRGPA